MLNRCLSTYSKYHNISTPTNMLYTYPNQLLLSMQQLRYLPKSFSHTYPMQRSTCRTISFKHPTCKALKSVNNYKYFWTVSNLNKSGLLATCKAFKSVNNYKHFWTVSNLNKSRLPAHVKSINKNDLKENVFADHFASIHY